MKVISKKKSVRQNGQVEVEVKRVDVKTRDNGGIECTQRRSPKVALQLSLPFNLIRRAGNKKNSPRSIAIQGLFYCGPYFCITVGKWYKITCIFLMQQIFHKLRV